MIFTKIISCLTFTKRHKNGPKITSTFDPHRKQVVICLISSGVASKINHTNEASEKVQFVNLDNLCQEIFNFKTLHLFGTPYICCDAKGI